MSDTKEKPFICRCGAAFARRDLLTRHQRIAFHEDGSESPEGPSEPDSGENSHAPPVEADLAAAVSLSGMSVDHWSQPPPPPPPQAADLYPMAVPRNGGLVDASYQQTLITDQFYENGWLQIRRPLFGFCCLQTSCQAIRMLLGLTPTSESLPTSSMASVCLQSGVPTSTAQTETMILSTQA